MGLGGRHVLVAVSGGPDSMALLRALVDLRSELGLALSALTVDHGARDATAEHRVVRERCEAHGVAWRLAEVTVAPLDGSWQAGARAHRRDALTREAARVGAKAIALGHTLDDQAETLLLRLVRGAGSRGLGGMAPVSPPYVRPLLGVGREAVLDFLAVSGEPWCEDPTNASDDYARNELRHRVLPALEAFAPGVRARLARTADNLRADADALDAMADRLLATARSGTREAGALALAPLRSAPQGLLPHALRRAAAHAAPSAEPLSRAHIDALVALARDRAGSASIALPALRAERAYDVLRFVAAGRIDALATPAALEVPGPGCFRIGEHLLTVDVAPWEGGALPVSADTAIFDADRFEFPATVRPWRRGDRVVPFGMAGHRKVSDVLGEAKIPAAERSGVLLVETRGSIAWVVGVLRASAHAVGDETRRVVRWRIWKAGGARNPGGSTPGT